MPGKNVTVSVRLSEQEAQALDGLKIAEADSQSAKLRAIIHQAQQAEEGKHSYPAALRLMNDLLDPVRLSIWDQERKDGQHSELLSRVFEWVPDMAAFLLAGTDQEPDSDDALTLAELESGIADRVFRLIEATLRLGLSEKNPCYDSRAISARTDPTSALVRLLDDASKRNA